MRWLRKFALGPVDNEREDAGPPKEFWNELFEGLPFGMTLPARWRPLLFDGSTPPDAVFAAHDPESVDHEYFATLVLFVSPAVEDADAHLADQERELRSGIESDSSLESYDLKRVTLPAGEALRFLVVHGEAQIQYYLPTAAGLFALWFTAPREELAAREAEFASIAQSFRVEDIRSP